VLIVGYAILTHNWLSHYLCGHGCDKLSKNPILDRVLMSEIMMMSAYREVDRLPFNDQTWFDPALMTTVTVVWPLLSEGLTN
jgi:hypothetical protein